MSRYVFEGKNFENCVVFSDERFGEIRMLVDDDGIKLYAGVDIAACMGYAAPGKVIMRCGIPGRIRMVPWVFKKKQGATDTRCFDEEEARQFIDRGQSLPEGFREWFFQEVVQQSRNIKVEREVMIEAGKEYEFEKCMEAEPNVIKSRSVQEDVFEKLDSIIIEILTLKKELAGKMNGIT